jgi:hypothetical protein
MKNLNDEKKNWMKNTRGKKKARKNKKLKILNQRQNENQRKSHKWKCQYMSKFLFLNL